MTQQKKRLLSVFGLITILCMLFSSSVTAQAPELSTDVSEVAEQKSVIDEQAMMLPIADISLALTSGSESLTISQNDYLITTLANENKVAKEKYISYEENESLNPYRDLIDNLTDDEKYLIYQITFLEAGNQSMEGQRAVIEVILNRVLSDKYPNTVTEVLSQSGQFVTWNFRNSKLHNEEQEEALQLVYDELPILTLDYLMFSRGKFSWGRNYIKIEDHWFGTF